jgi:hypothetical protein
MFLPLHAAGIYTGDSTDCCADYVVSSYTPTLTALLRAQKSNPNFHRRDARLGLIAAMQAWDLDLPILANVEEEIGNIRAAAKGFCISIDDSASCVGDGAVVARVAEVLKSTNMIHIACHGKQSAANTLSSGFCLSDATFSISHLMDLDLKDAFFAFLSACETAKGDEKQPDQTVHLAAAMLFVRFRSVAATMWYVPSHCIHERYRADTFQGNGGRRRPSSCKAILRETFRGKCYHVGLDSICARLCGIRAEKEWCAGQPMGNVYSYWCLSLNYVCTQRAVQRSHNLRLIST